ncbi:MAG: chorismate synthase, partial [Bacteroidetes bacterium]|nr:chorismate synthase [Bacteroidota bacterium]
MAGNTIGVLFRLSTFGESHGLAIGGLIDGCPAGLGINQEFIQKELDRRKPGQSGIVTQRKESDKVEFLSGIFEGKATGAPIGFIIRNEDQKPKDYDNLKDVFRPSHADLTYDLKYGIRDHRGGGRSSARETACRVVAGAIAKLLLQNLKISINAYVCQVGDVKAKQPYTLYNLENSTENIIRCPDPKASEKMIALIQKAKKSGDTLGGIITCVIKNVPPGLGEPVFDKLHADIGKAMLSINAVKGFEFGSGFGSATMRGSEHNDVFYASENGEIKSNTNRSGGIQGGISNGEDIYFNVAFKPVATILKPQETVDSKGNNVEFQAQGRHD